MPKCAHSLSESVTEIDFLFHTCCEFYSRLNKKNRRLCFLCATLFSFRSFYDGWSKELFLDITNEFKKKNEKITFVKIY